MSTRTATIEFEVPDNEHRTPLFLSPGKYTADVKLIEGEQLQYQLDNFVHSGDDSKSVGENPLIFIKQKNANSDGESWHEVFHNSCNQVTQTIGEAIEKAFEE
ncbi:MAG: hypothetical protein JWN76_1553 [Chitinophagaceae bacterium]|nr:hypothetical protein [Chitinophagaceae bacterium]